jgi:hypothetical protein
MPYNPHSITALIQRFSPTDFIHHATARQIKSYSFGGHSDRTE